MMSIPAVLLTVIVGTLGFCFLFHVRYDRLPFAILGGLLATAVFLLLSRFAGAPLLPANFLGACSAALYAEVCAWRLRAPVPVFVTPAMIPLVPGSSLYYATAAFLAHDYDAFLTHGIATVETGFGIAGGILVASLLAHAARTIARTRIRRP